MTYTKDLRHDVLDSSSASAAAPTSPRALLLKLMHKKQRS